MLNASDIMTVPGPGRWCMTYGVKATRAAEPPLNRSRLSGENVIEIYGQGILNPTSPCLEWPVLSK